MDQLRQSDIMILEAFSRALDQGRLSWPEMPDRDTWKQIFLDSQEHMIFPMVMESICRSGFFANDDRKKREYHFFLKKAEAEIQTQASRTAGFLLLYDHLLARGLKPLVVKGIVCRSLYPEPEHRPSSDEDLFIAPEDFTAYHEALIDYGLELADPDEDIGRAHEVSYRSKDSLLYIELHKYLFPPDSKVFGRWNGYFTHSGKDCTGIRIYGNELYTLDATAHFTYLFLHIYKHFLFGGFGLRQIADIVLFSRAYKKQIQWDTVEQAVCEVHAMDFIMAIYKIAFKYLFHNDESIISDCFPGYAFMEIDEVPLLLDIMEGGLYGASSPARQHSSNMTLYAMEQGRAGKIPGLEALLHAVFLPKKSLEKRYPYLKKLPILLPVAWMQRIIMYICETRKHKKHNGDKNNKAGSASLGNKRINLLKYYNIIGPDSE